MIEPEDFQFYEKMKVPPPTWCPECRLIRRLCWRNERFLYRRKCDLCKKDVLTTYHGDDPYAVYCHDCWYSDNWDPLSYGREYDFSRPFFLQWKELFDRVPRLNMWQLDMVDSPYSNIARGAKNAYLSYSLVGEGGENIFYSKSADASSNIFDCLSVKSCESCYENVNSVGNMNSHYCVESQNCIDSWFLFDCRNCQNCALSTNLRNQKYIIRNKKYSKEEYLKEVERLGLSSYEKRRGLEKEFDELSSRALHKFADIIKTARSYGNYIENTKQAEFCFNVYNAEEIKYCLRVVNLKDSYDVSYHVGSELVYEYLTGGRNSHAIRFTMSSLDALHETDYTDHCASSSNLFGCIGLRNKKNCILNKEYSEEEYKSLKNKILKHMDEMPHIDAKGRHYKYGEFFPLDLSPFGYNETITQEHFPITKKEAEEKGYRWREREKTKYESTVKSATLPDDIRQVQDSVLKEVITCQHHEMDEHSSHCEASCTSAFRVTPLELRFYRDKIIPLPRTCPNCRHFERLKKVTPFRLWHRKCMCDYRIYPNTTKHSHHVDGKCPNEFETSYAPERKEIVYCEQCYNAEVV